eukprot:gene6166-biopygen6199
MWRTSEGAAATVVAPYWPGQSWFGEMEALATEDDVCFYVGVVKKLNEHSKAHVLYGHGDEETLDLSEENFKFICSSGVSELTDETADMNGENIDCAGDYKENKRGGAVENFLTRSLCERWRIELGQSRFTDLAVRMQQRALLDMTLNNYGPKARRFILLL